MENTNFKPFLVDTALTDYIPIPRSLTAMDIPSTALLIYGALLDRATLSQKNRYADEKGHVFVIFSIENLARTFGISGRMVKRHMKTLEQAGLIHAEPQARNKPNHIYLNLPQGNFGSPSEGTKDPPEQDRNVRPRGQKVPPNNRNKQRNQINYYQHREEESL